MSSTEQIISRLNSTVLDHPADIALCRETAVMLERLRTHSIILHTLVARLGDHIGERVTIQDPGGGYMVHPVELLDGLLNDWQRVVADAVGERDRLRVQLIAANARIAMLTSALQEHQAVHA